MIVGTDLPPGASLFMYRGQEFRRAGDSFQRQNLVMPSASKAYIESKAGWIRALQLGAADPLLACLAMLTPNRLFYASVTLKHAVHLRRVRGWKAAL